MTVALDATPLTAPTGGIRRYVAELERALRERYPGDRFPLVSDQLTPPGSWWHRRWWLNGLPAELRARGADVFHGTDFAVPYRGGCPAVMTIHDLSPWRFPHPSNRVRQRTPWLLRAGRARQVITPSEAVRKEVMERFRVPAERVRAIPLAAAECFEPVAIRAGGRPYLLTVGAREPRKGLHVALAAWRACRQELDLVVVGRDQGVAATPEEGVRYTGVIGDQELAVLYSGAAAFLFPSEYEGFGLPVLEAMQCGAPVVISRDPALRETAGGAAQTAGEVEEWVAAIGRAAAQREHYRAAGFARARQFTWRRTAELHHEVYENALRSR